LPLQSLKGDGVAQPAHDHRLRHVDMVGAVGQRPPSGKRTSGLPIDHNLTGSSAPHATVPRRPTRLRR
jgi:hypothetical protein